MKKFLPLLAVLLCACGQKPAEAPKISIFCDHIWTVARQEGISFQEAATKIREIGYDGADVRVLQNPDELRILDSLGFGTPVLSRISTTAPENSPRWKPWPSPSWRPTAMTDCCS